jgi:integrase
MSEVFMSVRKRRWKTPSGEAREAWVVDYVDQLGERHGKNFARKRDAEAYHAKVAVDVRAGIHTPDSQSITVAEASSLWLKSREQAGIERATLVNYTHYANGHIVPLIGGTKLSALTVPYIHTFADRLRDEGRSPTLIRRLMKVLSSILKNAQKRGLVAQNVARDFDDETLEGRRKVPLEAGKDIPLPAEIRAITGSLSGLARPCWRPLLLTAIFTGLRISELRGLPWSNVDFANSQLHVRQRADRYNAIGAPKSAAGSRTVPLSPIVVNTLREWKLQSGPVQAGLVFPDAHGQPLDATVIVRGAWHPVQIAAGVVDSEGSPKYSGFHALRHFFASFCINRKTDGGLELPLKVVQARLGHATIAMTANVYGHLFPRGDDGTELAAAERALLA